MIVVLVLAAITLHGARGGPPPMDPDMAELAATVREGCVAESGVDVKLVEGVNAGVTLASTPDGALRCYIKCTMETAGMMADGAVDVDAVLALLPDEYRAKHEAGLRTCGTKKGGDDCETAYLTQICWQTASKDDYFLI